MDKSIDTNTRQSEYVVQGACLRCTLGTAPSNLNMPISHGIFLNGKAQCNVTDRITMVNIMPFGTCNISAPPPPCVPAVAMNWVNNKDTNLIIDNAEALESNANAFCSVGGIISITDSGQG